MYFGPDACTCITKAMYFEAVYYKTKVLCARASQGRSEDPHFPKTQVPAESVYFLMTTCLRGLNFRACAIWSSVTDLDNAQPMHLKRDVLLKLVFSWLCFCSTCTDLRSQMQTWAVANFFAAKLIGNCFSGSRRARFYYKTKVLWGSLLQNQGTLRACQPEAAKNKNPIYGLCRQMDYM